MGEIYIASINYIVILISLIGFYFLRKKPLYVLYIIVFFFLFKNFYIFMGTSFEIWKLLSLQFILLKGSIFVGSIFKRNRYLFRYLIFIIIVLFFSVVGFFYKFGYDINEMRGGVFKNEGRIIFQIIFFLTTINLILIPVLAIRKIDDLKNILLILLKSCVVLAIFGVLQLILVRLTGVNIFPIKGSDGISHSGYILDLVFRINSMAGEPKHMGIAMVVGITIILLTKVSNVKIIKYPTAILLLFLFNLFYTYSTTGYVLAIISIAFSAFLALNKSLKSVFFFTFISLGVYLFTLYSSEESSKTLTKQLYKADFEVQDKSIKDYFLDEPIHAISGVGLGNIHYYSSKYLPSNWTLNKDTAYKANTGILFGIADYGIIGLFFLFFNTYQLLLNNKKLLTLNEGNNLDDIGQLKVLINLCFVMSIFFLFRYNEIFFILIGCMVSLNIILRKNNKHQIRVK